MSDTDSENDFTVEKTTEPLVVKKKQPRTPAQLEALKKARLARAVKAQKKQEQPINLGYLTGLGVISAGVLGLYYYMSSPAKQPTSQPNLKPPQPPQPPPMDTMNTMKNLVSMELMNIKKQLEGLKNPEPEPEPEVETPPVVEDTPMKQFLKGAKEL
jgi:hypothetical protein